MKTFGDLTYETGVTINGVKQRSAWRLDCEPHVTMRVKRLFPRCQQNRTGTIVIYDTPEVARDLEWVLTRWPMNLDEPSARRLTARADEHRATEETVLRILEGHVPPDDWIAPAREPRAYQVEAAALIQATGQLLVGDDVGLGKSFTGILTFRNPAALPALVVTLTHLPRQWLHELEESLPGLTGHIVTQGTPYDPTERRDVERQPDVLIMNYAKLAGWADHLAGVVNTVIFDEVQELRRDASEKYKAAQRVSFPATNKVGLSATPVYNYGGEIYNVMGVLAPDLLGSREEFLREWGQPASNGNIMVKDPKALGTYLRDAGVFIRRTRADVGRELPDVIPIVHTVESDEGKLDKLMDEQGLTGFAQLVLDRATSREDRFRAAGELDWRMRHATGVAKAPYVAQFVKLLLESEERVVLFGWHHDVYDIWTDHLAAYNPVRFTGQESAVQKAIAAGEFADGDARVLIMSLRAGAGLDGLQEASRVAVFGELDWSPGVHTQCIGRLHRDGQDDHVLAYYLVSDHGSDPVVMDVLGVKRRQADPIVDPHAVLTSSPVDTSDRIRRLAADLLEKGKGSTVVDPIPLIGSTAAAPIASGGTP